MRLAAPRTVGALLALGGCIPTLPDVAEPCARWEEPGLYRLPIDEPQDGVRKPYVYVPGTEGPRPMVVLLHGGGMSGPRIDDVTEFQSLAEEQGFVLVYPNGLGWPLRHWNAGPGFGDTNDVKFLDDLVELLTPKVCAERVLATGFSNGAMMAHRWACETKTGAVDEVAVSSGPLLVDRCDGAPMPMRHYHGLADTIVPVKGGDGPSGVHYPSIDASMSHWRERNLCDDSDPEITRYGDVTCQSFHCAAPTDECLIAGWGHMWPGGVHADQLGADATIAIWREFREHAPDGKLDGEDGAAQ